MPAPASSSSEKHFAFGANWASYARLVGEREIEEAEKGLVKLVPAGEFRGRSFFDIGCGSGLHSLAATRLGVSRLFAVDYDPDSVTTARSLLERSAVTIPWRAERADVFELDGANVGQFDIVYSWGVLHHTGEMWRAVDKAASFVAPGGLLVISLYRTTTMDGFWKVEKRWYSQASAGMQRLARGVFRLVQRTLMWLRGSSYRDLAKNYRAIRGMDIDHDLHDWLGGYPYETALAPEVDERLRRLSFTPERVFALPKSLGVLGSGCDEYVYRKSLSADVPA
jgi:2-polyprenyl-6-hydroxyphenyl methylase/3-demethylubiquinone-9 3-methyltransferase